VAHARNIAILMAVALAIVAIPGGGSGVSLLGAVLSLAFAALIAYFVARFYRDHRIEIYGLGDHDRALLYGSIGVLVLVLAGSSRLLATLGGTLLELALLALCIGSLLRVYRSWQRY